VQREAAACEQEAPAAITQLRQDRVGRDLGAQDPDGRTIGPVVASWILAPPGDLTGENRAALAQITGRCAELNITRDLVRDFADMLCHAAASTWKPGPSRPRTALSVSYAGSVKDSARTGPRSPPGSPSLTAPAPSKAT